MPISSGGVGSWLISTRIALRDLLDDEEHKRALDMAGRVPGFLRGFTVPGSILADSGTAHT